MKTNIKNVLIAIVLPLAVGGLSSLISSGAMRQFNSMAKPPLAPPAWLFPVAWTLLYICMGIASLLIYTSSPDAGSGQKLRSAALAVYAVQLVFNFCWSPIFFNARLYYVAFAVLVCLWLLVALLIGFSLKLHKAAALLLVPYLLWLSFAGYLNLMIPALN